MSNQVSIDETATSLLQDIEAAYGYAHPARTRWPFEFLQPHYADSRESNLVERILAAYACLGPGEQSTLRAALREALERLLTAFQGSASRLLALLELNHRLNREALNSRTWLRLLDCRDPVNPESMARLLEGLIGKFRDWDIRPDIRFISWKKLLSEVSVAALPDAGEWLLNLAKQSPEDSIAIFRLTWERVKSEQEQLRQYWPDKSEIYDLLFAAFLLPEMSAKEKAGALREHRLPTPIEIAEDMEQQDMRAQLQAANDVDYEDFTADEVEAEERYTAQLMEMEV